jgi:phosphatidyl-myo-inositol alpha-mannosyltransferase
MNIGFLIDDSIDRPDGVQQYVLTLGKWYSSLGHNVIYICGESHRTDIDGIYSIAKNIRVRFNGNVLSIPLPVRKKKIINLLTAMSLDVLHVQAPYSPLFAARVIRLLPNDVRVVATFHILPFLKVHSFGNRLLGLLCRRSIKRVNSWVSVSKPAADFLKKSWDINSVIIPNTVDIATIKSYCVVSRNVTKKSKNNTAAVNIVFIGRLVKRKGCLELLHAYRLLQKKIPYVQLTICGDGPLRKKLQQYTAKYDLCHVNFAGFVSEKSKYRYLSTADIAIFPSLSGESFGIVLIEAMAAGTKTVIGGDNPGYGSVLTNGMSSQLINPRDSGAFSELLFDYCSNSDLRMSTYQKQQSYVKRFDVTLVGRKLLELYHSD